MVSAQIRQEEKEGAALYELFAQQFSGSGQYKWRALPDFDKKRWIDTARQYRERVRLQINSEYNGPG
jgi:hypothetical protein